MRIHQDSNKIFSKYNVGVRIPGPLSSFFMPYKVLPASHPAMYIECFTVSENIFNNNTIK